MLNPYDGINWSSVLRVPSVSHEHGTTESTVINLYQEGIRHIAMSNYYPSQPYYPASQFFPGISYSDLLFSPNAEQHNLGGPRANSTSQLGSSAHFNSIGSTFSSGSPRGESPLGCDRQDWRIVFSDIISTLQYADAGGITINHPVWSHNSIDVDDIKAMIDYSDRVLGIEIYNQSCDEGNENLQTQLGMWDDILMSGRKCWGFCVADHGGEISSSHPLPRPFIGRNILLIDSFTEHECLKAYRDGRFYGKLGATNLAFNNISLNADRLFSVQADNADYINIVIDGVTTKTNNNHAEIVIPNSAVYVRAEAHTSSDSIFGNPIIFETSKKKKRIPFTLIYS